MEELIGQGSTDMQCSEKMPTDITDGLPTDVPSLIALIEAAEREVEQLRPAQEAYRKAEHRLWPLHAALKKALKRQALATFNPAP